jgi:hypothetical protein
VKTNLVTTFKAFVILLRNAGPYVLIEMVLPGGTMIALLLYLYQNRESFRKAGGPMRAVANGVTAVFDAIEGVVVADDVASVWRGRGRERDGLEALSFVPTM